MVKPPDVTADMRIVPFPNSALALAVVGIRNTRLEAPTLSAVTTVLAALAVSVTVPTAFERPANRSRMPCASRCGFVSVIAGTFPAMARPSSYRSRRNRRT
jgi:hypothetical protein